MTGELKSTEEKERHDTQKKWEIIHSSCPGLAGLHSAPQNKSSSSDDNRPARDCRETHSSASLKSRAGFAVTVSPPMWPTSRGPFFHSTSFSALARCYLVRKPVI